MAKQYVFNFPAIYAEFKPPKNPRSNNRASNKPKKFKFNF